MNSPSTICQGLTGIAVLVVPPFALTRSERVPPYTSPWAVGVGLFAALLGTKRARLGRRCGSILPRDFVVGALDGRPRR